LPKTLAASPKAASEGAAPAARAATPASTPMVARRLCRGRIGGGWRRVSTTHTHTGISSSRGILALRSVSSHANCCCCCPNVQCVQLAPLQRVVMPQAASACVMRLLRASGASNQARAGLKEPGPSSSDRERPPTHAPGLRIARWPGRAQQRACALRTPSAAWCLLPASRWSRPAS
jgi:hypothetical protein